MNDINESLSMLSKAQEVADKHISKAKETLESAEHKAGEIIRDAEDKAEKILNNAREEAKKIVSEGEQALEDAHLKKEDLVEEIRQLRQLEADYRAQLTLFFEEGLEFLESSSNAEEIPNAEDFEENSPAQDGVEELNSVSVTEEESTDFRQDFDEAVENLEIAPETEKVEEEVEVDVFENQDTNEPDTLTGSIVEEIKEYEPADDSSDVPKISFDSIELDNN